MTIPETYQSPARPAGHPVVQRGERRGGHPGADLLYVPVLDLQMPVSVVMAVAEDRWAAPVSELVGHLLLLAGGVALVTAGSPRHGFARGVATPRHTTA